MEKIANDPITPTGSPGRRPASPQSIRDLRTRLGLTQEEFAHAIAVTVSTVNRWENGHARPSKLASRAIQTLARKHGELVGERRRRE